MSHDWEYRYESVGHRYLNKWEGCGLENQSASGVTTICLMQCDTSLQWLCEVAGYSREMEHTVLHVDPEHPKCVQLVGIQAMEELGHVQLPGIVYKSLQHGAMHYHAET
jgi:hypothetical protein